MSTSPGNWIDLLSRYGPVALFVFMVFVLLNMARATKGLSSEQKKVQTSAYAAVWLSIFVLAALIVVSWWEGNFPREFVVRGTISNLTYPETITTDQPVFFHRQPVAGLDFEYEWRIISINRFTGPLEFLLQKGSGSAQGGGTVLLKYKLQIREEFYDGTVDIVYDPQTDVMSLHHGTYVENIPGTSTIANEWPKSQTDGSEGVVYASTEQEPQAKVLITALDAEDPLIRGAARRNLIFLGPKAIPLLEEALVSPDSSYRLRVGILSTLKDMGTAVQLLGEPARCAIAKASKDPDPTLSAEAEHVISIGITLPSVCPQAPNHTEEMSASHANDLEKCYAVALSSCMHDCINNFNFREKDCKQKYCSRSTNLVYWNRICSHGSERRQRYSNFEVDDLPEARSQMSAAMAKQFNLPVNAKLRLFDFHDGQKGISLDKRVADLDAWEQGFASILTEAGFREFTGEELGPFHDSVEMRRWLLDHVTSNLQDRGKQEFGPSFVVRVDDSSDQCTRIGEVMVLEPPEDVRASYGSILIELLDAGRRCKEFDVTSDAVIDKVTEYLNNQAKSR
jgi:hypothetical protein